MVECFVANENVIGSNPISRSKICLVNSAVECLPYKEKVGSSILSQGTKFMESWSSLVYGDSLENCRTRDSSVGSNPTLSSILCPIGEMDDHTVLRTQR